MNDISKNMISTLVPPKFPTTSPPHIYKIYEIYANKVHFYKGQLLKFNWRENLVNFRNK